MHVARMAALVGLCSVVFVESALSADFLEEVPQPWTPVSVKPGTDQAEVGVWGRTYRFDRSTLPAGITTAGREILDGPVRLVGTVDGQPIEWQRSGLFVLRQSQGQATLCGWQANASLIVDTTVRVEFDGMMQMNLVVLPQRGAKPKLDRLWLEIPLKRSCASLFHSWPGRWGTAQNSGALTEAGLAGPFKPLVWLGWEDGGLCWFAESDRGWQPEAANRAMAVVCQGQQAVLRLRLLDSPPPALPLTFTVGLQATPVKPWPTDFHEWRIWHAPQLATTLEKPAYEVFPKWWTCHRAFPDGKWLPALDRAAKLGVKTVVFHEDWTPIQDYPVTPEEPELKRLIDACHQRGMKVLLYFGYEMSPLAPEWAEMSDEVLLKNVKGAIVAGWHRLPEQRDCRVCFRSRYQDFLVEGIARLRQRCRFDGVYLDGTIMPAGCANERHGCGYRRADGELRSTYPIFAVRRLMQRLYAMIHPDGGLINAHQSTCCMMPTLAFADSYWDGEQFSRGELAGDPMQKLPLDAFRAEFMGRNFGVPCEFLTYERGPDWTIDHALAFTMIHDVRVRPHGSTTGLLQKMSAIWDVMTRFGVGQAEWHPYWKNAGLLTVEPAPVKASLYVRRAEGNRPARGLLVVSNLSAKDPATAQVQLNVDRSGLRAAAAKDALSGERLAVEGGRLSVPLQPMRMRVVWLE